MAGGVNFAVYSRHATDVFLLLFDRPDGEPTNVIRLANRDKFIWHGQVQGTGPGQLYGYKARGEYRPERGVRFNDAKLLLDPYARAVTGKFRNVDQRRGKRNGPDVCLRGLDNPSYYSLTGPEDMPRRYYMNYTGCGNSLDFNSAPVIRLVMDSLGYWVEVMRVDGFRFDLASVLGRTEDGAFKSSASFFDAVSQDPVLNRAILIAEPWDVGVVSGGQFSGGLVRMERPIPRHAPALRERRRGSAG
jgi:pullulanase/glycogen debranching enzyme